MQKLSRQQKGMKNYPGCKDLRVKWMLWWDISFKHAKQFFDRKSLKYLINTLYTLNNPLYHKYTENTRWVSSDIKRIRQGFENARWIARICWAIQHAFSSQVRALYQKTWTWYFIYQFTLQTSDYDLIMEFNVDPRSLMSFKKCNVTLTWYKQLQWDRQSLSGQCATMQLIWEVTDKICISRYIKQ